MFQKIKLSNLHKRYKLNERIAKRIITEILRLCKVPGDPELELIFLDDKAIRKINRRYKSSDRPTDVLSFYIDREEFGLGLLGEIFISLDAARRQSKIFGTSFPCEVVLYMIHGILHLFGYDDEDATRRKRMFKKQDEILKYLWKKENLSKVLTRP